MVRVAQAIQYQMEDGDLKVILTYALAVGNFLNGNTNRGDSYGFKMSEINKLIEVRSTYDSNKTILGYIISQIEKDH